MDSPSPNKTINQLSSPYIPATIERVELLTPTAKLVHLLLSGYANFSAGQYMCFYHRQPSYDVSESADIFPGTYSIASSPSLLPVVHVAVEDSNNPRNLRHHFFRKAQVGDVIWAHPTGFGSVCVSASMLSCPLPWNGGNGGVCLIAGGFGIPGVISIANSLCETPKHPGVAKPEISVLHSVRNDKDIPFYPHLKQLAEDNQNVSVLHTVTRPSSEWTERKGRFDIQTLAKVVPRKKLFCVYGSEGFVKGIVEMLLALGVWPANIRTDYSTRIDTSRLDQISGDQVHCENGSDQSGDRDDRENSSLKVVVPKNSQYLQMSGMQHVLQTVVRQVEQEKPEKPLSFTIDLLTEMRTRLNGVAEVQNERAADPQFWVDYWQADSVRWHNPEVSPWLRQFEQQFLGTGPKRVFVPLCGKSVDLLYLLRKGHTVIGADCSGIACADFFSENGIGGYKYSKVSPHVVEHKSTKHNIRLFECDIFRLTPSITGPIDCILDRAALVALHPSSIANKYLPLLQSLLPDNGIMLLASVSKLPEPVAPPHCYSNEQMSGLLSRAFRKVVHLTDYSYELNAGKVTEPIFLVSSKRNGVKSEISHERGLRFRRGTARRMLSQLLQ